GPAAGPGQPGAGPAHGLRLRHRRGDRRRAGHAGRVRHLPGRPQHVAGGGGAARRLRDPRRVLLLCGGAVTARAPRVGGGQVLLLLVLFLALGALAIAPTVLALRFASGWAAGHPADYGAVL